MNNPARNTATATAKAGSPSSKAGVLDGNEDYRRDPRVMFESEAADINAACERGDMVAAYRVLARMSKADAAQAMLVAGFSILGERHPQGPAHLQQQIAQACKLRLDGYTLQVHLGR